MHPLKWLLDKRFVNRVRMRYEKYNIQAGILKDGPHFAAQPILTKRGKLKKSAFTDVDGMKARRMVRGKKVAGPLPSIAHVARDLRRKTRVNFWTAPFKRKASKEVKRFKKALMALFGARQMGNKRKLAEQLLVEAIRAPIKRRQYGPNRPETARMKGFNRRLFDTGQVYRAIKASIKRKPSKPNV